MTIKSQAFLFGFFILAASCNTKQEKTDGPVKKIIQRTKPAIAITYHFEKPKQWLQEHKADLETQKIIFAVNRTDSANIYKMDSILIPNNIHADIAYYLPFPLRISMADSIDKIIFFSYASQSFAAYENGDLIYTGPTNMGRKSDPTPTGLYFTNWKAEKTTSTFDDEWELKWNFNIQNKEGIGWHQYALPGYPASHSCLRLSETDARYLYSWANQWVLEKDSVRFKGTPVIVFGNYNFTAPKPWLQLVTSPHALDMDEKKINDILLPYIKEILQAQQERKIAGI